MRIAVTGAGGRLGRALVAALDRATAAEPSGPIAWRRPDYDLDTQGAAARLLARDRPDVIIHAAAWTDVDGCAREPELALRRNGAAVGELAAACAASGVDLVLISTNEVFDGRRTDRRGYVPADEPQPINPYGASKLAGETAARAAFRGQEDLTPPGPAAKDRPQLAIVRTAWLYGPPGGDFPAKILAAADRADANGSPLRVVGDEFGSPTYTLDLAQAIVDLMTARSFAGLHHLVNHGVASRAGWAQDLLRLAGRETRIEEISSAAWPRASTPPRWAVLAPEAPGIERRLRPWQEALADYVPLLLASRPATVA